MTDLDELLCAAYQSERVASRRLAARSGIPEEEALRATLLHKAGSGGLAALLAERRAAAEHLAELARQRVLRRDAMRLARAARHEAPPGTWRAWFDGSAKPNPGRCAIGALLTGPAGERIAIAREAGYGNSSEAEYLALIAVLEAAVRAGATGLTIHGDSRVVIDDVAADAGAPALDAYRRQARALLARLGGVSLRWVPRHRNGAADALAGGVDAVR